jgi:hypothetical protein
MYPISLAQIWMHSIEFSLQTFFLQFFWISKNIMYPPKIQ